MRPNPPWQPTAKQAPVLEACLAGPDNLTLMEAWLREQTAAIEDPGIQDLLPYALPALLTIAPDAVVTRQARDASHLVAQTTLPRVAKLVTTVRALEANDVPVILLKGVALAVRYYRRYDVRTMGDVDLLIRHADAARATRVLIAEGWRTPGDALDLLPFRLRIQHAEAFTHGTLHSLDLHWRPFMGSPVEEESSWWDHAQVCPIESGTVRVLDPTAQLLHLCAHAIHPTWQPSPRWVLDAHVVLTSAGEGVEWQRLAAIARRTAMTRRIAAALAELRRWMPTRVPAGAIAELERTRTSRWESRELAWMSAPLPFVGMDRWRWHWFQTRRLRHASTVDGGRPHRVGMLTYMMARARLRSAGC